MLGYLNHVAIAVPDLNAAMEFYRTVLGAFVSDPQDLPDHGVRVCAITLSNSMIELLEPLGDNSPIQKFLERNPKGGMHHMSFEVPDVVQARDRLVAQGVTVLGDGTPKIGFHGTPVIFLKPTNGVLIELEEVKQVAEKMGDSHTPLPSSQVPKRHDGLESIQCTIDVEDY